MKKRIFSVALSLCMAFSLLPGTALATDGDGGTEQVTIHEYAVARNKPVDEDGTVLSMVTLTEEQYNNLKNTDGTLTITVGGESYTYHVSRAADDGNRYIWVPDGAVIGGGV